MRTKCSTPKVGDERLPDRFWRRVVVDGQTGCWNWTGGKTPGGYGRIGRFDYTHRLTYKTLVGRIPDGLQIDHLCRNRACCNPEHLEPVTQRENILRSPVALAAINARKTHCKRGHEFTSANTVIVPRGRKCRTCMEQRQRDYRETANAKARARYQRKSGGAA